MALTVLLTGFGPFPGAPSNPTDPLVRRLARWRRPVLSDVRLVPHIFPTRYRAVDRELPRLVAELKPDAVLMFGLSGKASCLRVETRARNSISALIHDAAGEPSPAYCIVPGGPAALAFDLPAARMALAARRMRAEAAISRDAGRYLCNYLCWRAIETAKRPGGPKLVAFIHVPRRGKKGWHLADMLRGAEAILLAAVAETRRRRMKKT